MNDRDKIIFLHAVEDTTKNNPEIIQDTLTALNRGVIRRIEEEQEYSIQQSAGLMSVMMYLKKHAFKKNMPDNIKKTIMESLKSSRFGDQSKLFKEHIK